MSIPSPTDKYHITYSIKVHKEGLSKAEVALIDADKAAEGGVGGCDAIVLVSLMHPPDGSLSTLIVSKDGQTDEELDDSEIFKAWVMMSHKLANSKTLPYGKRDLCKTLFDIVAESLKEIKEGADAEA